MWVFLIVAAALHFLLKYTDIGRNVYAIGGNDTAARLAGININRYIIGVYALVGVVAAIAGILITARTGSGQPVSGSRGPGAAGRHRRRARRHDAQGRPRRRSSPPCSR